MTIDVVQLISSELNIHDNQVRSVIELLADKATIPFISRYRKEATGNLDEVQVKAISDRKAYLDELEERKQTILTTIDEQEKLTPELKAKIEAVLKKTELEDIYAPYKPKRKTRAIIAKAKGLEPLAEKILAQRTLDGDPLEFAQQYVDGEKGVATPEEALQGAMDIIAETIADNADLKGELRELIWKTGKFVSKVVKKKEGEQSKFEMYYDFNEKLTTIPSHRILAMRRGETEKVLKLSVTANEEKAIERIKKFYLKTEASIFTSQLRTAVADSYARLLQPSLETEIRAELKERADLAAIKIFATNLRELLLSAPLGNEAVTAIDPGIRTGSKMVALSSTGDFIANDVIYTNSAGKKKQAAVQLAAFLKKHPAEYIAIGNGTGSREMQQFVDEQLRALGIEKARTILVNEAGASVYSASDVAREEFPDLDLTVRGAISIGRRLQDPLSELVKIDPKSIGVGQYQHDVDQKLLANELDVVVMSCVNYVGVDLNTASVSLLRYVSGISKKVAGAIVQHRADNGVFTDRKELKKVKGIGAKAFEQCAGFLRIRNGTNPLDNTAVHPESYYIVDKITEQLACTLPELLADDDKLKTVNIRELLDEKAGEFTVADIIEELKKPGRDPRESFINPEFDENVNEITDLEEGMVLNGVITNMTAFGAFCDIGVHQDGLIHISQMAHRFVKDPSEVVKLGQQVKVKVTGVEVERKRIALTMKLEPAPPRAPRPRPRKQKRKPKPKMKLNSEWRVVKK